MLRGFLIVLVGVWLAMGAFMVPVMAAETLLDAVRKDHRYQKLSPDQQERIEDKALKHMLDRFDLFTNCEPMAIVVEDLSSAGKKLGLTNADIQANVESRLRAARIYTNQRTPHYLHIVVSVIGRAFSIDVEFKKSLFDSLYTELQGGAGTWRDGITGTHGGRGRGGGSYILSGLSQMLDRFIADYLRVNETACATRP